MSTLSERARRFVCRTRGHRYATFCDGLKRRCDRCWREEWVFSKSHPKIGEPKYSWRLMWEGK
jgi:hypothetical protein